MAKVTKKGPYGQPIESLVGSAGTTPVNVESLDTTFGEENGSDGELWMFYDRIPEAFWFVQFVGRNMRNLRLFAGARSVGTADPVPLGRPVDVDVDGNEEPIAGGESDDDGGSMVETRADGKRIVYESKAEMRAVELLAMIDNLPALAQRSAELGVVTGRGYLVGHVEVVDDPIEYDDATESKMQGGVSAYPTLELLEREERISDSDDIDELTDIVRWDVYSTRDLKATKGKDGKKPQWRLGDEDLHPNTYVFPMIDRHPNEYRKAKSAFMAARDALRRICRYQAAQKAMADSRLAMRGLFLIASDWEIPAPAGWDSTKQGEWKFEEYLHQAMIAPLSNPGTSTAVAPLTVSVPYEFLKDGWAFIDFFTSFDDQLCKLIDQDLGRIAIAWDAPTPLVTSDGLTDTNHWNLWAIQESADVTTWRPLGSMFAETVQRYICHQLAIEGYDPASFAHICVHADTSEIMSKANRVEESCTLYDKGLLTGESTVSESGFSVDQMPSKAERDAQFLRQVALRTADGELQDKVLRALGFLDADGNVVFGGAGADGVAAIGAVDDSDSVELGSGEGPPDVPSGLRAAGVADTADLVTVALVESAATELVRSVGNFLRHRLPKDMRAEVDKLEPWQVAPVVGQLETAQILDAQPGDVEAMFKRATFRLQSHLLGQGVDPAPFERHVVKASMSRLFDDLGGAPVLNPTDTLDLVLAHG